VDITPLSERSFELRIGSAKLKVSTFRHKKNELNEEGYKKLSLSYPTQDWHMKLNDNHLSDPIFFKY